jgi:hypothetical protein
MKRIVNSYMVSRYIANKMNPGIPSDSVFYTKLLKFTIVLEQWPKRMAWMLLVVENLQQELGIRAHNSKARRSSIEIGESLTSLFTKLLGTTGLSRIEETKYPDLSLIDIRSYSASSDAFFRGLGHSAAARQGSPSIPADSLGRRRLVLFNVERYWPTWKERL